MTARALGFAAFYAALLALLAFLVRQNQAALAALRPASLALLAPFPLLALGQMLVAARANQGFFAGHMAANTLANNVKLGLVNMLGNLLPVSLGMVSKGIYAHRKHDLAYTAFLALTAYQFGAGCAWSGLACLGFAARVGRPAFGALGLALLAAAAVPFLDVYGWLPARIRAKLPQRDYRAARATGRRRFPAQFAWQGAMQILNAAMLFLMFRAMGLPATAWQVFLIFSAVNLSRYANFTPGGLGIPEGLGGAVSASLGIPFPLAFLALSAARVLDIACALLAVPFLFHGGASRAGVDASVP